MKPQNLPIIVCILGVFLLCAGGAKADTTFTYSDDYANWPGYPQSPPFTVNPADELGSTPKVSGAVVTVDANNYLKSIDIKMTNPRGTETLFIQPKWSGSTPYDQWKYFVGPSSSFTFYSVSNTFNPNDYILVPNVPGFRVGHPDGIIPADLSAQSGFLASAQYVFIPNTTTVTDLIYTFQPGALQLFDANTKFVIGLSEDCGNDVFLTPVPEPLTLLLLGTGLLGLAGLRRRLTQR